MIRDLTAQIPLCISKNHILVDIFPKPAYALVTYDQTGYACCFFLSQ
jgi:hypothetical protein